MNSGEATPSFEAPPQPPPEVQPGQEQAVEAPAVRPETSGNQPQAPALPAVPADIPAAEPPVIAAPPEDLQSQPVPRHPAADTDRLEPVWKHELDNVIAHTQDDPHARTIQIDEVKKEYQRTRFNKQTKSDEAAA